MTKRLIVKAGIEAFGRDIPVSDDMEYASQITLTHALEGRREL